MTTFLDDPTPLSELPEGQKNILRAYAPEVMKFIEEEPEADELDFEEHLIKQNIYLLEQRLKEIKEKRIKK